MKVMTTTADTSQVLRWQIYRVALINRDTNTKDFESFVTTDSYNELAKQIIKELRMTNIKSKYSVRISKVKVI